MNDKTKRPDDAEALRSTISEGYARVAETGGGCGGGTCCSPDTPPATLSLDMGYSAGDLAALPQGADLGLGCGAPVQQAALQPGETVVDLGAGAGIDAFLAARDVGPDGHVIGVDMTDAMLERARANAAEGGVTNVEFRKGLIEDLPVDDASVDVILSNCVINLSPEKHRVFAEATRVLRPGGRMVLSYMVLEAELPVAIVRNVDATVGCVGNAVLREEYLATVREAGFSGVEILSETSYGGELAAVGPLIDRVAADTDMTSDEVAGHLSKVTSLTLRLTR